MKKSTFATGLVVTGLAVWGLINPLAYVNTIGRLIEPMIMDGTTGSGGFVGLFLVATLITIHAWVVFTFWLKVVRRVKEVLNK